MRIAPEPRERTKKTGSSIIGIFARLPRDKEEVRVIGSQAIRSGTSVAAHVREASGARSNAEFRSKPDALLQ